jgi:hypothetical protein
VIVQYDDDMLHPVHHWGADSLQELTLKIDNKCEDNNRRALYNPYVLNLRHCEKHEGTCRGSYVAAQLKSSSEL